MTQNNSFASGLYVVATPIGNLGDLSERACAVLAAADAIICEDTRKAGLLYQRALAGTAKPPFISYHDHSRQQTRARIIGMLKAGKMLALISDAGTPLISDPGYRLISDAIAADVNIYPIPGVSAVIAALSVSGLECDRFCFLGFAPSKKRDAFVASLMPHEGTIIFYESPLRIVDLLKRLQALWADRRTVIAREMTKLHEEILRGTVADLHAQLAARAAVKGEITVLLAPLAAQPQWSDEELSVALQRLLSDAVEVRLSMRAAIDEVASISGAPRRHIYRLALALPRLDACQSHREEV